MCVWWTASESAALTGLKPGTESSDFAIVTEEDDPGYLAAPVKVFFDDHTLIHVAIGTGGADEPGAQPPTGSPERAEVTFGAMLTAGQPFVRTFGADFLFSLLPEPLDARGIFAGWHVVISRLDREENLCELTVPLRGPDARDLLAWHFLPGVSAPGRRRVLAFSPDVGTRITEADLIQEATGNATPLMDSIYAFGQVDLTIKDFTLNGRTDPRSVEFDSMTFAATISWPKNYGQSQR